MKSRYRGILYFRPTLNFKSMMVLRSSTLLCAVVFFSVGHAWSQVGHGAEFSPAMNEFRSGHAMAAIDSWLVLAAGGWDGSQVTTSAEVGSPYEEWEFASDMAVPRTDFAMYSLPESGAIVAGGWDGQATNHSSTEIFDVESLSFTAGPDLSEGRANLVAVGLTDGRILFCGGFNGNNEVATVDIYDPVSNTMSTAASMIYARSAHSATLLPSGRVLVAGGFNPNLGFQMNQCEVYDPESDTWTEVSPLNVARDNFGASGGNAENIRPTIVAGGRVFNADLNLFQGIASAEEYDEENDEWTLIEMPHGTSYNHLLYEPISDAFTSVAGVDETGIGVSTTYATDMVFDPYMNEPDLVVYELPDMWEPEVVVERYRSAVACLEGGVYCLVCGGDEAGIGSCVLYKETLSSVEEERAIDLSVFPNPSSTSVQFSDKRPHEWVLINNLGQHQRSGRGLQCDLNGLPAGCYFLQVDGPAGTSIRIMKQ